MISQFGCIHIIIKRFDDFACTKYKVKSFAKTCSTLKKLDTHVVLLCKRQNSKLLLFEGYVIHGNLIDTGNEGIFTNKKHLFNMLYKIS